MENRFYFLIFNYCLIKFKPTINKHTKLKNHAKTKPTICGFKRTKTIKSTNERHFRWRRYNNTSIMFQMLS